MSLSLEVGDVIYSVYKSNIVEHIIYSKIQTATRPKPVYNDRWDIIGSYNTYEYYYSFIHKDFSLTVRFCEEFFGKLEINNFECLSSNIFDWEGRKPDYIEVFISKDIALYNYQSKLKEPDVKALSRLKKKIIKDTFKGLF